MPLMLLQAMLAYDWAARNWLQSIASCLGLAAGTFESLMEAAQGEAASRLEAIQYTLPDAHSQEHVSCREHIDRGLLTVIYCDHGHGLQVCKPTEPSRVISRQFLTPHSHKCCQSSTHRLYLFQCGLEQLTPILGSFALVKCNF